MNVEVFCFDAGRSREGAWIEMHVAESVCIMTCGRSREGAWIEMLLMRCKK